MKIVKKGNKASDAAPKDDAKGNGKKGDAPAESKKSNLPPREEYKYDVNALAERLGIKPASVRVQLRNKEVPKAGKSYGWNTDKEFEAVVKQLKSGGDEKGDKKK